MQKKPILVWDQSTINVDFYHPKDIKLPGKNPLTNGIIFD
jgi:hypothetical protein